MNFDSFNLHPGVMAGVQALGYVTPTPIQEKAIPHIMQGRDIIGLAQTGTGKTAAFALPILHRLLHSPRGKIGSLIISPTRELAEQTHESFSQLGWRTGLRSVAIYGGVGMDAQIRGLRNGAEIVVACPGRLLDHIWKGNIDFPSLKILVIDEADRLFDMGFLPDIREILKCILHKHQTLLFSATMPDDIRRLVREILDNPVTVQIGSTQPAVTVSHAIYPVKQHLKIQLLEDILHRIQSESVLVFTRTKYRAEGVARALAIRGYRATSLQGNLTQSRRQAALDGFREGSVNVLVATDIAARGLDVSHISHVINYDMPGSADDYIHRIGRTGRIGNTGEAFTLVTSEDAPMVRTLERLLKAPLERRTMDDFNYDAPAPAGEISRPYGRSGRNPPAGRRPIAAHRSPSGSKNHAVAEQPSGQSWSRRRPATYATHRVTSREGVIARKVR
ncbi:MAG: DEAD/DEAH box helicase [Dehalococcoidia bacterium]|nr:DEAD/DEAH box helicase [Dehalococcoidia bacterium]